MLPVAGDSDFFIPIPPGTAQRTERHVRETPPGGSWTSRWVQNPVVEQRDFSVLPRDSEASTLTAHPLRRKRRLTIRSLSREPAKPNVSVFEEGRQFATSSDTTLQRSSVTISRSSSLTRKPTTSGPSMVNHAVAATVPATSTDNSSADQVPTNIVDPVRDRLAQSRSPRPQYPPTSWKKHSFQSSDDRDQGSITALPSAARNSDYKALVLPKLDNFRITLASTPKSSSSTLKSSSDTIVPEPTVVSPSSSVETAFTPTPARYDSQPTASLQPRTLAAPFEARSRGISLSPDRQSRFLRSRRRDTLAGPNRDTSAPASLGLSHSNSTNSRRSRPMNLPEPELAYARTDYFSACPHTSPPQSRPLNVQPVLRRYQDGVLAYPPRAVEAFNPQTGSQDGALSIIDGACCDCDLATRRHQESEILEKYNSRMDHLSQQLEMVKFEIGLESLEILSSNPPHSEHASLASGPTSADKLPNQEGNMSVSAIESILAIESRLNDLVECRDREIKFIWRGYTNRWGPATVGIHRGPSQSRGRSQSIGTATPVKFANTEAESYLMANGPLSPSNSAMTSNTAASSASFFTKTTNGTTTMPSTPGGRSVRSQSRSIAPSVASTASPRDRYSDGTRTLEVDSNVDGVYEGGRMVVDWIRPERNRPRMKTQSRSPQKRIV